MTSPSCLAYLDSGLTFVGSEGGDSQLVRISATPVNQVRYLTFETKLVSSMHVCVTANEKGKLGVNPCACEE